MKNKFLIILILFYFTYNKRKDEFTDSKFIEWGIKKNLTLSSFIGLSSDKKVPKFIANEDIEKNQTLLNIPYDLMFNLDKALNLTKSKSLKRQYNELKDILLESDTFEDNKDQIKREECFISYILYLIDYEPKKYQKTKFYEVYKYFIESLKIYQNKKPLFFDYEGLEKLYLTYISTLYKTTKDEYEEEIITLKGDSFYKQDIEFDDYLPYRINIHNEGIIIFDHKTMVPFLKYFDTDYIKYNVNYTIEKNGSITIFSTKKIKKNEEIIISSKKMPNERSLLFEGKTYEELIDYYDEYLISAFSPSLYYKFDIQDNDLEYKYIINLAEEDFDEYAINFYKDNTEVFKFDKDFKESKNFESDGWAYEILLNNIKAYKQYITDFKLDKIYEYFDDIKIRIDIERIIKGETKFIKKAYSDAMKKAGKFLNVTSTNQTGDKSSDL